jgi:3-oxoacyl-[acyl-carrier-protein] synthase II
MNRRIVITGTGVITAIGTDVDDFWRNCLQGKSAVAPIPESWCRYADLHSRVWSPLPDLDYESLGVTRIERLTLDPVTVLALGAAREALASAGFEPTATDSRARTFTLAGVDGERAGVFLGTGTGGVNSLMHNHTIHLFERARATLKKIADKPALTECRESLDNVLGFMAHGLRFNPYIVSMLMPNAPSASLGIKFSITGPNVSYCLACASGTAAIGHAYRQISLGHVDVALTGGSEYLADDHGAIFRGFDIAGTLTRDCANPDTANRPFDVKRSGFLFSQGGAAILVLEALDHALKRGATPIAEVIGYAETFDAHSMMSLAPGGGQIERMIRAALADAGVTPGEVNYVNAHGTGTENNDKTEAEVIGRVFGKSVLVNSTKSLLGHTIGASGAIEALVTALSLRDRTTHVCRNLETPVDDLNFVRVVAEHDLRVGVSQSFAFGGHNAAVVMRRYQS